MTTLLHEQEVVASLSPYRLFRSSDLDETRSSVGRIFKPHALGVRGTKQKLDAQMDHLAIGRISINRLRYGADVSIEPGSLENFLLVQMPVRGSAEIECGTQKILSTPAMASVITPAWALRMRWHAQCDQLIVRIERSALEAACGQYLGHALPKPLEFGLGMDLRQEGGQAWQNLVMFLATGQFTDGAARSTLVASQIEQLLISMLLTGHPNNYRDHLLHPADAAGPGYIKRAEDYMLAHCDQPVTMESLSQHVAISARSLQAGFRQFRGTTPMAFLRLIRLQRVREELLCAKAGGMPASISRIALDWGFAHLGHFTAAYQKQFNETPSQTLDRGTQTHRNHRVDGCSAE